ncbi:M73 family metallopeptidase [Bacillus sp. FJAT-49705]|uniref:M73 family metallopeptidase n=1 Tax=Cytobacillus citreus TaxID=2833586 RepID=A0ABS5NYM4_9BACI|nr:CalY family protein [Cytobacillus citreus]MBS4192183.1 M73 family metallopeptidase [Cytobacillus citreus]
MSIKKKFGLGIASAALGLSLVGGGTFAYFSDTEVTNNTFAAGTLDLSVNPKTIVNVDNIKPGDTMLREFKLVNNGSLDIDDVLLSTDYKVTDAKGNNVEDFGEHIRVNFLYNADKDSVPIFSKTLKDLKDNYSDMNSPDVIIFWDEFWNQFFNGYLAPGTDDTLYVQFEFVDNGQDQNQFQGDSLQLEWTFNATQTEGEER